MKKKKDKLSPDVGLAIEQFEGLNKSFYEGFVSNFYDIKLNNLMFLFSNPDDYINSIVGKKLKIGKSVMNIDKKEIKKGDIKKFAKLELAMTYYHCLETFIRLFLAHATLSDCPWLDLSRLTNRKYKTELENLSNNNFKDLNNILNENDSVLFVLSGFSKCPKELSIEDIEGLKNWVVWSALQLLKVFDYNAFKHGLAISPKYGGIKIVDNGKVKINVHGDILEFISRTEKETRYVWTKETILVSYDARVAIIFTVSKMIQNIMNVGRALHFKESLKSGWIPKKDWSPGFISKNNKDSLFKMTGFKMTGFKKELLYYEDN